MAETIEAVTARAKEPAQPGRGRLGIVLTGGGARAAYQVGLLRCLAREFPDLRIDVLTGVSAGAINAVFLANFRGDLKNAAEELSQLWLSLTPEKVFSVAPWSLLRRILLFNLRMLMGGARGAPKIRGMVDTEPLRRYLHKALETPDGTLPGIEKNLESGQLSALALTTIEYATAETITWVQANEPEMWQRTQRHSEATEITLDHVMASAALPILFPATRIGSTYHGDGGIRLAAPLSPALHLGADRIIALSTRFRRPRGIRAEPAISDYPPPLQVAGVLLNAVFLDMLDQDVRRLELVNRLLEQHPQSTLRPIDVMLLRPSEDLGRLAGEFEIELPSYFRFVARGFGSKETKSPDVLSMLMFQKDYIARLIEIGERDAEARMAELSRLVDPPRETSGSTEHAD